MRQVVEGMRYLHSHNILHRDISLSNLLITKDMNIVSILKQQFSYTVLSFNDYFVNRLLNLAKIDFIKLILICCEQFNIK